jgi:hypothetical protein
MHWLNAHFWCIKSRSAKALDLTLRRAKSPDMTSQERTAYDSRENDTTYRVIWIRERGEGDAAVEISRGVLFPGPLTHEEACTCMRKAMRYPGRRLVAEVISTTLST